MIKVDISKALPPSAFDYLAALVPGLFFEISIVVANPKLLRDLATHLQQGFAVGYYVSLFLFLFAAFVIGNGFLGAPSFALLFLDEPMKRVPYAPRFLSSSGTTFHFVSTHPFHFFVKQHRWKGGWAARHYLRPSSFHSNRRASMG